MLLGVKSVLSSPVDQQRQRTDRVTGFGKMKAGESEIELFGPTGLSCIFNSITRTSL